MANPQPLVALPGHDLVYLASASMTNEDAAYPATNLLTSDPADVAKSTTNATTITLTTASSTAIAFALINTNATTATVNTHAVTVPALDLDGQRTHGWLDRRSSPVGPTTTWTIVLSRASGVVWLGRPVILTAVQALNLRYGLQTGRRRPGDLAITTRGGSIIKHGFGVRTRWARGVVDLLADEPTIASLEANAQGSLLPFLFIPDEQVNDAWFVSLKDNDFTVSIPDIDVREIPLAFEEISSGPPNG